MTWTPYYWGACSLWIAAPALRAYKGSAFQDLNEALRFGGMSDELHALVEDLDVPLGRMRLSEPVVAYSAFELPVVDLDDLVGDVITDEAYLSTSLLRSVAEEFVSSPQTLLAEIVLPAGAEVGVYAAAPDLIAYLGEAELLLPRGSALEIRATTPTLTMEALL